MIDDVTESGIPLPHRDNPARADIDRIRAALEILDERLGTNGLAAALVKLTEIEGLEAETAQEAFTELLGLIHDGLDDKQDTLELATGADLRAGADDAKMVTAAALAAATAISSSAGSGTWEPDLAAQGTPCRIATGASTLGEPTGAVEGRTYVLLLVQDATGGRGWSHDVCYDFGAAGTPTNSTGANKVDVVIATCLDAEAPLFRATFSKAAI